ncbi:hypothetical protein Bca52824_095750 [Brassica carinata]|uniref:Uncharacterized protein n=1 Tax=Brassica carinata TaxID=52824 RepID=A0A8X7TJG4_BRACI|nr:hypothetical protein Bca52824_095750 [Brassica carinata]
MIAPSSTLLLRSRGHHCGEDLQERSLLLDFFYARRGFEGTEIRATRPALVADTEAAQSDAPESHQAPTAVPSRSSEGKYIDLGDIEFSMDDSMLPGWDPTLLTAMGVVRSEVPIRF